KRAEEGSDPRRIASPRASRSVGACPSGDRVTLAVRRDGPLDARALTLLVRVGDQGRIGVLLGADLDVAVQLVDGLDLRDPPPRRRPLRRAARAGTATWRRRRLLSASRRRGRSPSVRDISLSLTRVLRYRGRPAAKLRRAFSVAIRRGRHVD